MATVVVGAAERKAGRASAERGHEKRKSRSAVDPARTSGSNRNTVRRRAANDVGLIPWVPLTLFDGPPEAILQQCRERIDQQAPPNEHENLLAVTQVLTMLRYNDPQLLAIIGGRKGMIESPYLQSLLEEVVAERLAKEVAKEVAKEHQRNILQVLTKRFGSVPLEIRTLVEAVSEESRLDDLLDWAIACPDLDAFRARLTA